MGKILDRRMLICGV